MVAFIAIIASLLLLCSKSSQSPRQQVLGADSALISSFHS